MNIQPLTDLEKRFSRLNKQHLIQPSIKSGKNPVLKPMSLQDRFGFLARFIIPRVQGMVFGEQKEITKDLELLTLVAVASSFKNSKYIYPNDAKKIQNSLFNQEAESQWKP